MVVTVGGDGSTSPSDPGPRPLRVDRDGLGLAIVDDEPARGWRRRGPSATAARSISMSPSSCPPGHESLNVVIPWSDERFNYTSKHQARPADGALTVGDGRWSVGGSAGEAWGVLDVGRGRWPSEITWNWGGGAGRRRDHVVGLQFGGKWTEGTGFTENGVIVDGRLTKLGRADWHYDWDQPMEPWRVDDPGGQLDVLTPRFDKHTRLPGGKGSETHQVFGTWSGTASSPTTRSSSSSTASRGSPRRPANGGDGWGRGCLEGLVAGDGHPLHHPLGREEVVRDDVLGGAVVPEGDRAGPPAEAALHIDDRRLPVEAAQERSRPPRRPCRRSTG